MTAELDTNRILDAHPSFAPAMLELLFGGDTGGAIDHETNSSGM